MIERIRMTVLGLLTLAGTAEAHPHSYVDQQAMISVGLDAVVLTVRIVPSFEDGAAIFALIDADGNGVVSDREAAVFGAAVVKRAELEIDGRRFALRAATSTVPSKDRVSTGFGMIEVEAVAPIALGSGSDHRLAFSIGYQEFAHDWLIQPFFYRSFVDATSMRRVERTQSGNRVAIAFSSASALAASFR